MVIIGFALSGLSLLATVLIFYASGRVSAPLFLFGIGGFAFGLYARHLARKRDDWS